MLTRTPSFYHSFHCIASACPDSCCQLWDVAVDAEKSAYYRSLPGELGDRLRRFLQEEDSTTYLTLEATRCPMWRQDGLCRIQAELGEQALCKTCREFPRLTHDYGGFLELGLELSCPEAARLLLAQSDWHWLEEGTADPCPDYDPLDMEILLESRHHAMELTQGEAPLVNLLLYGLHAQQALDSGELPPFQPSQSTPISPEEADVDAFLQVFRDLEILTDGWRQRLQAANPRAFSREDRAMLRYLISRWWLQAISDFDLYARVKFLLSAVILCCLLGGDPTQTAQQFSKEIENDAQNVDALLDGCYTLPGLTDRNLLALMALITSR